MRSGLLNQESVLITAENHWTTSQSSAALRTSGSGDRHGGNLWDGWLRSTLLGEYVSLFILAMALMAVNARSVCAVSSFSVRLAFAAMAGILISVWAVGRSVGLLAGRAWAALVNVALVLVAVGVFGITSTKTPEWLMYGPIGRASLLALLLFVLFLDGMDFVSARSRQISLPDIRRLKGRCLLVAVGTIGSLWSVGVPLLQSMWWTAPTGGKPQLEQMGFFEHVGFRFGEALVTFCFFLLGANIGSFLNVVVWRLPQGLSIVTGDSSCPWCKTGILRRDNVPIWGCSLVVNAEIARFRFLPVIRPSKPSRGDSSC